MAANIGSKRLVVGAHYGLQEWLAQRVTALVLGIYLIVVGLYFFIPLLATFLHSIKPVINGVPDPTLAYRTILGLPNFYGPQRFGRDACGGCHR